MNRVQLIAIISIVSTGSIGGCGTEEPKARPHTLEYITAAILKPSCGTAQCHSSFTQAARREKPARPGSLGTPAIPLIFDSVETARKSFQRDSYLIDRVGEPKQGTLFTNLTVEYDNAPRMPFDGPLPDSDLFLIDEWVQLGGPGVCEGDSSCYGQEDRYCTDDGAFDFDRDPKGPCAL